MGWKGILRNVNWTSQPPNPSRPNTHTLQSRLERKQSESESRVKDEHHQGYFCREHVISYSQVTSPSLGQQPFMSSLVNSWQGRWVFGCHSYNVSRMLEVVFHVAMKVGKGARHQQPPVYLHLSAATECSFAGTVQERVSVLFHFVSTHSHNNLAISARMLLRVYMSGMPPPCLLTPLDLWILLLALSGWRKQSHSLRDPRPGPEKGDRKRLQTWTWGSEPVANGDWKSWRIQWVDWK